MWLLGVIVLAAVAVYVLSFWRARWAWLGEGNAAAIEATVNQTWRSGTHFISGTLLCTPWPTVIAVCHCTHEKDILLSNRHLLGPHFPPTAGGSVWTYTPLPCTSCHCSLHHFYWAESLFLPTRQKTHPEGVIVSKVVYQRPLPLLWGLLYYPAIWCDWIWTRYIFLPWSGKHPGASVCAACGAPQVRRPIQKRDVGLHPERFCISRVEQ